MNEFGKRMKQARLEKHLMQKELAQAAFVGADAIKRYERGVTLPRWDSIVPIAKALGVSLDWLAGRSVEMWTAEN